MNLIKRFIFFIILSLFSVDALPTVYGIIVLQNLAGNRIFLFQDIHIDYLEGRKSKKQQADVLYHAKKLNAHVIAEDICNYDGDNKEIKRLVKDYSNHWQEVCFEKFFMIKPTQIIEKTDFYTDFFLSNILKKCDYKGISYFNGECRQAKIMSDGKGDISGKTVSEEFWATEKRLRLAFETIKEKDEHAHVYYWANKKLDLIITELLPLMNFLKSCATKFKDLAHDNTISIPQGMKYGAFYDSQLVDLNIIANVCKNYDKKNIFICAGSNHIVNIIPVLQNIGYNQATVFHGDKSESSNSESNIIKLINEAPDIHNYFKGYYEHAQICSICNVQLSDTLEFFQHKIECLQRKTNKKYLLWGTALIAAGVAAYKAVY